MEYTDADEECLLEKRPQPHNAAREGAENKDRFFALCFAGNLGFVAALALFWGLPNVSSIYFTIHHDSDSSSHGVRIFLILLSTSCIGGCVSALWLQVLQRHAATVIEWTLRLSIVVFIVMSIVAFSDSGMGGRAIGFINLFLALMMMVYYSSLRPSIAFAAANLTTASRVLHVFPGVVSMAYVALAVQAVWTIIWSVAVVGVLAKAVGNLQDSSSFGNICFFFMLLSLFWVIQVVRNVVHCVAAGAVGEWWVGGHDVNTVSRSQQRAVTSSLGSICLGSLVVAALNALQFVLLSTPRRKSRGSVNACLECMIKIVKRNMEYFNKFAFCQVAIYGKDFRTAGVDTMRLFRDRGWTSLVNDSLISNVLTIGCVAVGAASGVIGSAWMYMTMQCTAQEMAANPLKCETFNVVMLTFAACASIGYAMCAIVSSILDSIVATVFVCFAEDPAALQRANPDEHARLIEAWARLKPELLSIPSHYV